MQRMSKDLLVDIGIKTSPANFFFHLITNCILILRKKKKYFDYCSEGLSNFSTIVQF